MCLKRTYADCSAVHTGGTDLGSSWTWLSFIPFCETEPPTQQTSTTYIECCLPLCSLDHHELKYHTKQWPQDASSWSGHLEI